MINVGDYVAILLKKKGWTLTKFAEEINKVKKKAGINSKTNPQNINNFLKEVDDKHILRPKQLCIWEVALELPFGYLMKMVKQPSTKEGKKELEEIIKKVRC